LPDRLTQSWSANAQRRRSSSARRFPLRPLLMAVSFTTANGALMRRLAARINPECVRPGPKRLLIESEQVLARSAAWTVLAGPICPDAYGRARTAAADTAPALAALGSTAPPAGRQPAPWDEADEAATGSLEQARLGGPKERDQHRHGHGLLQATS